MNVIRITPLAILLLLNLPASAKAGSAVDEGVTRLAQAVSGWFEREEHPKSVFVGAVTSPDGDGDAELRRKLIDALKAEDFTIRRGEYSISGRCSKDFRAPGNAGIQQVAMRLKAEIRDRTDEVIQPIAIPIFGDDAVNHLNPTAELPADLPEGLRQEKLNDAIDNPQVAIDGSVVRAEAGSRFGVEILVRNGTSLRSETPTDDLGFAFVELKQKDEYVVRLHNRADFEAAVTLQIDGLSMYAFSEDGSFGNQVLVPPGTSVDIPGWYINNQETDVFLVTSYAQSAAKEQSQPRTSVGVISAAFHAAWSPEQQPPADEAAAKSADTATGRGRRIDQKYVTVKRVIGKQRSLIAVRYNR